MDDVNTNAMDEQSLSTENDTYETDEYIDEADDMALEMGDMTEDAPISDEIDPSLPPTLGYTLAEILLPGRPPTPVNARLIRRLKD